MVPTSSLFQMWIKTNRCLVSMKDLTDVSSPIKYKSRYKMKINKDKDSTVYTTEYWSKKSNS